jgi:succinyl-diaminopimelate desuccinylase
MEMIRRLNERELDKGNAHFQPSNFEVTTIDTGNTATNVIPGAAHAVMNIRFNDEHTGASLDQWMRGVFDQVTQEMGGTYTFETKISGESFITEPGDFSALVADAIKDVTGETPELSTTGGTSDARFIRAYAPVVEFGFRNATMHKVDEHVAAADFGRLADIYEAVLRGYFKRFAAS